MYFLFNNDRRRFGWEVRIRSGVRHYHLILFHKNLCLSLRWWSHSNESPINNPNYSLIDMWNDLDRLEKFKELI